MRHYFVPLTGFLLSILLQGLITNARAIGPQPEPPEVFNVNVHANVFNSTDQCKEHVYIEGLAHAEIDVNRTREVIEIMISIVVEMRGVGRLTGARYLATGTVQKNVATQELPARLTMQMDLTWIPLDRCRLPRTMTKKLTVPMVLEVNAAGALTALGIPNNGIFDLD